MKPIRYLPVGGLFATSASTAPVLADSRLAAAAKQPLQAVTVEVGRVGWGRRNRDLRNMGRRLLRGDDDDNGSRGRRVRGRDNDDDNGGFGGRGGGGGGGGGRNNDDD